MTEITLEYLASTPLRLVMPSVWYPGFLPNMPNMPDLLVFRLPDVLWRRESGRTLNNEYKIIFVETTGDRRVVEEALDKPLIVEGGAVDYRPTIDRPNARRSSFPSQRDMGVLLYVPPEEGWPHLVVTMMPRNIPGEDMARERYAWDAFPTATEAMDHMAHLRGLAQRALGKIRTPIVTPDTKKYS